MESPSVPLAKDHHYAITIVVNVVYRFYGGWFDLSVGIVSVVIQRTKPILVSVDAKWIGRGKFIGNAIVIGCKNFVSVESLLHYIGNRLLLFYQHFFMLVCR